MRAKRTWIWILSLLSVVCLVAAGVTLRPRATQAACQGLARLSLPNTTILSAIPVPPGVASSGSPGSGPDVVLAHCLVQGAIHPTPDSDIRFELWLPASGWNGKYMQIGNGSWAGSINVAAFADPLQRGYAVAGTDDGHVGGRDALWAIGHPEKFVDFAYRAVHETSLASKAVVRAFFGREPAHSYFSGCSDGGREGLMEAERYPADFDGLVVGAPAADWSHLMTDFVWNAAVQAETPMSAIPQQKLPLIQGAALVTCDMIDGVRDGLIEDPRACHFDPSVIECHGPETPSCLTPPQVEALRKIYGGAKNPRTGEAIFPGYVPGDEALGGWAAWITPSPGAMSQQLAFGNAYYGQVVFEDPRWDYHALNFDRDVAIGDQKAGVLLDATNPDLRAFRDRGGKIVQYHGWDDPAISPYSSIDYYDKVRSFLGKSADLKGAARDVRDFYRLFLVPGLGHCDSGVGPCQFGNEKNPHGDADHDVFSALERWVEQGVAPTKIIGSGPAMMEPGRRLTRPLCPYPEVAKYRNGDPNDAASFACAQTSWGR